MNSKAGLAFWLWDESAAPEAVSSHSSDYNLWDLTPGAPLALLPSGESAATLGDWRRAMGQDGHSLAADPRFVAAQQGDFRVLPDSLAVGNGANLDTVRDDYSGRPRPQVAAPSIGAYER